MLPKKKCLQLNEIKKKKRSIQIRQREMQYKKTFDILSNENIRTF